MSKELKAARELVRILEEKEKSNKVLLSQLNPGETFMIGEYIFIVLKQEEDSTKVISKGFMAEDVIFDSDVKDYNASHLKNFIESNIQPVIESEIGADNLIEHVVDLTSVDMQNEYGSYKCKVRPITFDEAREFNEILVNKDLDDWWWTCTPWSTEERGRKYLISVVSPSGLFDYCICYYGIAVRPFCILKSNIFVSRGE